MDSAQNPEKIIEHLIRGGSQRTWDREVGYGPAPDWYLEDRMIEVPVDKSRTKRLLKRYGRDFKSSNYDR